MSRNGSGVYSLPAGNPVVTGTTISSSWANTTLSDIATALTGSVAADGQTSMTGNLQMGSNKITGLAVATATGDALSYGQAATVTTLTTTGNVTIGGTLTLTGGLTLNGNVIVGDSSSDTLTVNATSTFAAGATFSSTFAANGGATLGDASGDALTINSSAVSIPNGLNFDSNTFVIDATNNAVGIGTNSIVGKLHVYGDTNGNITERIENPNAGSSAYANLQLRNDATNTCELGIQSSTRSTTYPVNEGWLYASVGMNLGYAGATKLYAGNTERMRITSAGNVGIGTSSPNAPLSLAASTGQKIRFYNTLSGYSIGVESSEFRFVTDSGAVFSWRNGADYSTATEYMRLNASGNLGLGVTPSAWGSNFRGIQLKDSSNLSGVFVSGNGTTEFGSNYYNNGTNEIYTSSWFATKYRQLSGVHSWYTTTSGTAGNAITFTQAMTLDASGRLGIGQTSPRSLLDITTTTADALINLDGGSSNTSFINFRITGTNKAYVGLGALTGGSNNDLVSYVSGLGNNIFYTNSTERMRIDSSGRLLLGTTAFNYGYSGYNMIIGASAPLLKFQGTVGAWDIYNSGSGNEKFYFAYNGADRATINQSTGAYTAISDRNKKKDFEDSSIGLDAVMQLKPTLFRMLEDAENAPKQLGFIAQDVENVIPQAYVEEEGGMGGTFIGLQDRPFIAVLTKAIQEQQAIINDLKARIETLESK